MTQINARISSDNERYVSNEVEMFLPEDHKPPLNVNLLIVTKWGKLLVGRWSDEDCCEWYPLPNRNTKRRNNGAGNY